MSEKSLYLVTGSLTKSYNYTSEDKAFSRIVMAECEDDAIILVTKAFDNMNVGGVTNLIFDLEANEVITGNITDLDRRRYQN